MKFPFFGKKEKTIEQVEVNFDEIKAEDIVAPSLIEIKQNYIKLGERMTKSFFVFSYPRYLTTSWLSPLINLDSPLDIALFIHPADSGSVLKRLRKKSNLRDLSSGPGKLCQALKIDRSLNKTKAFGQNCCLWIEQRKEPNNFKIGSSGRIGVDYAGPYWASRPWRFFIKNNQFVSKK